MLILAVVANVPDVGSVTPVVPVTVNVVAYAPLIVSVLATLFAMPVPPRLGATATPFHVALVIDPVQSSVLVDQLTFEGACACVSQVPAAVELTSNVKSTKLPDCNVARVVPVLPCTTTVPLVWLLLNEKIAPAGNVVASGSL